MKIPKTTINPFNLSFSCDNVFTCKSKFRAWLAFPLIELNYFVISSNSIYVQLLDCYWIHSCSSRSLFFFLSHNKFHSKYLLNLPKDSFHVGLILDIFLGQLGLNLHPQILEIVLFVLLVHCDFLYEVLSLPLQLIIELSQLYILPVLFIKLFYNRYIWIEVVPYSPTPTSPPTTPPYRI